MDPVDKAHPKMLHYPLTKPNEILDVTDIHGARPDLVKFKTGRRDMHAVNPVDPDYKLPSSPEVVHPEPRKFLRDAMYVSDIPGTSPRHWSPMARKDNDVSDIKGTSPK